MTGAFGIEENRSDSSSNVDSFDHESACLLLSIKGKTVRSFFNVLLLPELVMEELQELDWFDGSTEHEQLLRELLADNDSPFFLLPESCNTHETVPAHYYYPTTTASQLSSSSTESIANHLVSNGYSGPTIQDIEIALSLKNPVTIESTNPTAVSGAGVPLLEKGSSNVDNKYTLKIKTCNGEGMSDDGYKWRKYGQKSIKNSSNPRSYYRCTNQRCSAKKQVERSKDDPDVLIVTYEGLHLHFTYSHFLPTQSQIQHHPYPSMKKPKCTRTSEIQEEEEEPQALETLSLVEPTVIAPALVEFQEEQLFEGIGSQGLLEDMVPLMIRNPPTKNNSTIITWSNSSSSSSSYTSSPPTTSPPTSSPPTSSPPTSSSNSFSWSPNCSSIDFGHVISSTTTYEGL